MLSLFAQAIEKLGENVAQYVPRIMEAVFECTLLMITRNFEVTILLLFAFLGRGSGGWCCRPTTMSELECCFIYTAAAAAAELGFCFLRAGFVVR